MFENLFVQTKKMKFDAEKTFLKKSSFTPSLFFQKSVSNSSRSISRQRALFCREKKVNACGIVYKTTFLKLRFLFEFFTLETGGEDVKLHSKRVGKISF